jgi:hypothetical protein
LVLEATHDDAYVDAGATCFDPLDGNLNRYVKQNSPIISLSSLNGKSEVKYTVTYTCKNHVGCAAKPATRTVVVRDTRCPRCTPLVGPARIEASFPYVDSGALCTDDLDGAINDVTKISDVNVESTGTYHVTYRVKDKAANWNDGKSWQPNNKACKNTGPFYVRKIVVIDTLKPAIALKWKSTGETFMVGSGSEISKSDNPEVNKSEKDHPWAPVAARFGSLMSEEGRSSHWTLGAIASGAVGMALVAFAAHKREQRNAAPIQV